jgi:hypothetical protein
MVRCGKPAVACLLLLVRLGPVHGQAQASMPESRETGEIIASAGSYRLQWRRHFQFQTGLVPTGVADEAGNLWLITHDGPRKPHDFITKIDPDGLQAGKLDLEVPLTPIQMVGSIMPGTSENSVALLASVTSGGRDMKLEGAYFVPVLGGELGLPILIKPFGAIYPVLTGVRRGQFVAASDQSPIVLVKLDATGKMLWRRSLSHGLALPTVSLGSAGTIFVLAQGKDYLSLQTLDPSGRTMNSQRISARSGLVVADPDGGCTVLFSDGYNGKDNVVSLATFDEHLRQSLRAKTPFTAGGGRTYQLMVSPHGHLIVGEGPTPNPPKFVRTNIVAELDGAGTVLWQQKIESLVQPLLVPFRSGFYIVRECSEGAGFDVEKYAF